MRKILIVEDDKVLNKTLAYNLTADGYEVTSAYSFLDAVEHMLINLQFYRQYIHFSRLR